MRTITGRQFGFDVAAAALFALVCGFIMLVNLRGLGSERLQFVPLLLITAAVALRRLSPAVALALAWISAIAQLGLRLDPSIHNLGICAVLFATAAYGGRVLRWFGLASAVAGATVATAYLLVVQSWFGGVSYYPLLFPGQLRDFSLLFIGSLALLVLSWVSGLLIRSTRAGRAAREREEEARHDADLAEYRVVVEQERNRIARDMHDVVAHSLAVVIAQADGARFAASARPEVAVGALETISSVARDALGDVRMLLAELRHDEGSTPQPSVADLDALFGQLRGAGLELRVHESGERRSLGAGHDIAAYRIIQEGLTNALRHGTRGEPVDLTLFWAADALHLELVNAVGSATDTAGVGHGLPGMRERAQLAGGMLEARADDVGHFVVRAGIPFGPAGVTT
ncbi:sensor histidine kinase [Gryllotalpicola koreensis]|uniref:histidine kinase n=1 Tax=Gryllotalpicola koreensis TaxID=993086 RepID=A0ABP7ZW07_9MICO